jgi:DNA-binding winged helix-turn-helix (wHTH) protein
LRHHFGPFTLDIENAALHESGKPVPISRQPLLLLEAFVRRPGSLLTRDELARILWPPGTPLDTEQGLNAAIRKLRRALGDSAQNPRYLQTVPQYGYRFIAKVSSSEKEADAAFAAPDPRHSFRHFAFVRGAPVALLAALVGVLISGILGDSPRLVPAPGPAEAGSSCEGEITVPVSVVRVHPRGTDDQLRSLADVITEDLVDALWDVDELRLAASTLEEEAAWPRIGLRLESDLLEEEGKLTLCFRVYDSPSRRLLSEQRVSVRPRESYQLGGFVARHVARAATSTISPRRIVGAIPILGFATAL